MAQSRFTTLRVGLLIALGIGLFCFSVFSIGYGFRYMRKTGVLVAHFRRTNGLESGAPVTLSGVKVGAVYSLAFPDEPNADYVIVRMWVEERAFSRIASDSVAHIQTMGLLGDKFIEISAGSPGAPRLEPGAQIASRDPIDYEEILQKQGTQDLLANLIEVSLQMRKLLESLNSGKSVLSELIMGENVPQQQRLTLASMRASFDTLTRLANDLDDKLRKIDQGKGLFGAMMSDKTNGQRILANFSNGALAVQSAAKSTQETAQALKEVLDRYESARGAVPRLLNDKEYGDQLLANLRDSSAALRDILRKIDSGQGSIGLAVNDPQLYENASAFLSGGTGVAAGFLNLLYGITHPFASPAQPRQTYNDDTLAACVSPRSTAH